jgi:hypothetical protein
MEATTVLLSGKFGMLSASLEANVDEAGQKKISPGMRGGRDDNTALQYALRPSTRVHLRQPLNRPQHSDA